MSYFAAGYVNDTAAINDMENSFNDVVPVEIKNDVLRIREKTSFLLNYGGNKVINDIVFHDKQNGSWFGIIGTSLANLSTNDKKLHFLQKLFIDPKIAITNEVDGCSAIIAYDAVSETFYIISDYNNTIPIYYAITSNGIYVSSHELQLARLLQSEIDPLGFSMTIYLGVTWGSETRFKNITKLLPCQIISFKKNKLSHSEQYWTPLEETQWSNNFDEAISRWLSLLKESVRNYYDRSNNQKVICDFTAGEDSRLILSLCHALGIPFQAMVEGLESDIDVKVAKEAARKVGFDLEVRGKQLISKEQLLKNAIYISLMNDGYQDYFRSSTDYATDEAYPPRNYEFIKFCGAPGGEAFRGAYYLRGKAIFPSSKGSFDYLFFTRMKYLLDFYPGLLRLSDGKCKETIFEMVKEKLQEVGKLPVGIRIDHLLRTFQTCNAGLIYKNPRYLPFAAKNMTRSIYNIPPNFKKGGKLTKACTEILYPELAIIKTQKGVPTIRKTPARTFMFFPEYLALFQFLARGTVSRLFRWTDSNKPIYKWSENGPAIMTLLENPPFCNWFSSSKTMVTGYLYNNNLVDSLLSDAKAGSSRFVPILGRVLNQEIAARWVYQKM